MSIVPPEGVSTTPSRARLSRAGEAGLTEQSNGPARTGHDAHRSSFVLQSQSQESESFKADMMMKSVLRLCTGIALCISGSLQSLSHAPFAASSGRSRRGAQLQPATVPGSGEHCYCAPSVVKATVRTPCSPTLKAAATGAWCHRAQLECKARRDSGATEGSNRPSARPPSHCR